MGGGSIGDQTVDQESTCATDVEQKVRAAGTGRARTDSERERNSRTPCE